MKDKKQRIGVLTLPLAKASVTPLTNLVEILVTISTDFVLVTGNEGYRKFQNEYRFKVYEVSYTIGNLLLKVIRNLYGQIKAAIIVIKLREKINYWFILGGERVIFVIIIAKLLKKKVIILVLGSTIKDSAYSRDPFFPVIQLLSRIKLTLADKIIVYSPLFISDWHLEPYRHKVQVAHEHYLDFDTFKETIPLPGRPALIGYIGRLSGEKGVRNFVEALPLILNNQKNLRVFIGGDGPLNESIEEFLQANSLTDHVDNPGWISHEDLPRYLNQLRLLIIPSYTEGLPNILLEAMACGTPVLATPVGAIPDVIKDGETGFILEDNSPECIARNVARVLGSPHLEVIAKNGQRFVEENFVFGKTRETWKKIINDL